MLLLLLLLSEFRIARALHVVLESHRLVQLLHLTLTQASLDTSLGGLPLLLRRCSCSCSLGLVHQIGVLR